MREITFKEHLRVLIYTNDDGVPTIQYIILIFPKQSLDLVSPSMATLYIAAFVEGCHWFIGRPGLNLHEISPWVLTFWTGFCSGIHIFPSSRSSKNIINLLQFGVLSVVYLPRDVVHIWTCVTRESKASLSFFHD